MQPLLTQLALGCTAPEDALACARGLACGGPGARGAALAALPSVPGLAGGACPVDGEGELVRGRWIPWFNVVL